MTTASRAFIAKLLEKKYGVLGIVASRYVKAGYSVEINHPTRYGPIPIVARKGGSMLAIEVLHNSSDATLDRIKLLREKAALIKAKPVLVIYSTARARLHEEVVNYCRESGVKIKFLP